MLNPCWDSFQMPRLCTRLTNLRLSMVPGLLLYAMRRILNDLGALHLLVLGFATTLVSIAPGTRKKGPKLGPKMTPNFGHTPGHPLLVPGGGLKNRPFFGPHFSTPRNQVNSWPPHKHVFGRTAARLCMLGQSKRGDTSTKWWLLYGCSTRHTGLSWFIQYQSEVQRIPATLVSRWDNVMYVRMMHSVYAAAMATTCASE